MRESLIQIKEYFFNLDSKKYSILSKLKLGMAAFYMVFSICCFFGLMYAQDLTFYHNYESIFFMLIVVAVMVHILSIFLVHYYRKCYVSKDGGYHCINFWDIGNKASSKNEYADLHIFSTPEWIEEGEKIFALNVQEDVKYNVVKARLRISAEQEIPVELRYAGYWDGLVILFKIDGMLCVAVIDCPVGSALTDADTGAPANIMKPNEGKLFECRMLFGNMCVQSFFKHRGCEDIGFFNTSSKVNVVNEHHKACKGS